MLVTDHYCPPVLLSWSWRAVRARGKRTEQHQRVPDRKYCLEKPELQVIKKRAVFIFGGVSGVLWGLQTHSPTEEKLYLRTN